MAPAALDTAPVACLAAFDTAPLTMRSMADEKAARAAFRLDAGRLDEFVHSLGQHVDALGQPLDVVLRVTPNFDNARATRSSNTCSNLSQSSAYAFCTSLDLGGSRTRAPVLRYRRRPCASRFQRLALLHQRFKHFRSLGLRAQTPPARLTRSAGTSRARLATCPSPRPHPCRSFRLSLFQHRDSSVVHARRIMGRSIANRF